MEPDRCISCIRYGRKLYTEKSSKLPFLLPAYFRAIALPRFGNHVASCGYTAIKSMVANRATQYATVPRNISPFFKRSEEHTSELQSLMRISYAVFCLKKKIYHNK